MSVGLKWHKSEKMHKISFHQKKKKKTNQKTVKLTPFLHVEPPLFTNILHLKEITLQQKKKTKQLALRHSAM